jgi:hypothetical protein
LATGIAGTVFIALFAFWLSFTALTQLAVRAGISAGQAWAWPLIVDGVIVVATVAVVALRGRRGSGYAWVLLVCGAVVSVTANAVHASMPEGAALSPGLAAGVCSVPPVVLLAITHLTVVLARHDGNDDQGPRTGGAFTDAGGGGVLRSPVAARPPVGGEPEVGVEPSQAADGVVLGGVPVPSERPVVVGPHRSEPGRESRTWQKERVLLLRADGWPVRRIAGEVGVHSTTVSRWLKEHRALKENRDE